jgi:hypothetical protein
MSKKTIAELLNEAKALKQQEAELKARMKAQKQVLATEYVDGLSETEKQKQIADAEKILETAKAEAIKAKETYKSAMKQIKSNVSFAKDILAFVNHKQTHSLPKQKNSFAINGNLLTFNREGIKQITIDISKANWQQNFKQELKKQGINGNDRIADNIVYKATTLIKANIKI